MCPLPGHLAACLGTGPRAPKEGAHFRQGKTPADVQRGASKAGVRFLPSVACREEPSEVENSPKTLDETRVLYQWSCLEHNSAT